MDEEQEAGCPGPGISALVFSRSESEGVLCAELLLYEHEVEVCKMCVKWRLVCSLVLLYDMASEADH